MTSRVQIYLASASPRRRILLEQIGISYETLSVSIDETPLPGEQPDAYVRRLALAKAHAGRASLNESTLSPVMGADTAVCIDGRLLGKPRDKAEGLAMLARLSGREHQVLSAVAVVTPQRATARVQTSQVRWRELSAAECMAYWETGEAHDKAGGYGIQGRAAAFIVELHGSYSGVMGLPLFETAELLKEFGIHVL